MKPSTVVRCAIANEIFRRRKQMVCDNTIRSRADHHSELLSITFEGSRAGDTHPEQQPQQTEWHAHTFTASPAEQCGSASAIGVQTTALDSIKTPAMHRRKSSVWKLVPNRDRTSSAAVIAALHLNAEHSALHGPANDEFEDIDGDNRQDTQEESHTVLTVPQQAAHQQREEAPSAFRFPQPERTNDCNVSEPKPSDVQLYPADLDSASPVSDSTLFEDPAVYSLSQLKGGEGVQACSTEDGTSRYQTLIVQAPQVNDQAVTPAPRRRARHQRHVSTSSAFDAAGSPPIPLRSRAKTNDGLLLFKANTGRDTMTAPAKPTQHRRKVSLNLPVNAPMVRSEGLRHPGLDSWTELPDRTNTAQSPVHPGVLTPQERELEYKHRHTFIGTGSLDDFLELLEMSPTHVTTKGSVARAFVHLSTNEQLYARQCSKRPEGWEVVSRTTLDVMDVTSVDYVVQLQVKLGSITLRQFLDMVPFDENSEVAALLVVEAFSAASHIDAKAGVGAVSKARAFRSWVVTHNPDTGY